MERKISISTAYSCNHQSKISELLAYTKNHNCSCTFTIALLGLMLIIFKCPLSYTHGLKLPLISNSVKACGFFFTMFYYFNLHILIYNFKLISLLRQYTHAYVCTDWAYIPQCHRNEDKELIIYAPSQSKSIRQKVDTTVSLLSCDVFIAVYCRFKLTALTIMDFILLAGACGNNTQLPTACSFLR